VTRAAAPACRGCELWEPATQVVFSAGSPKARVAMVGEQPGDVEDQRGIPFVGPAYVSCASRSHNSTRASHRPPAR
jgi:uracil-DNA glycosylase